MLKIGKRACSAALLLTFGLVGIPSQVFAQALCIPFLTCPPADNSPPTVSITSPASGATVSGTINVTANASDNQGVAGVQFKLDGANLGAEDTASPYAVSWNTTTASNGSHTLTAVARDSAGNSTTSSPVTVTVSNAPAPPPAQGPVTRYEETDPSVSFGPGWIQDNGLFGWSGGFAMESQTAGAQATFAFTGTSVAWLGMRGPDSGIARVSIDGVFVSQVDMFARSYEIHVPVFVAKGLADGSHTLTITVTGLKNTDSQAAMSPFAVVIVDAFEVPAHVVSHFQDTDPDWSYTGNWTFDDTTRSWSGWMASISSGPGAQASLPFNGTSVSWIGYRGPDAGIAQVFIDGALAGTVDLYFSVARVQAIVFTSQQLAAGNHTIAIVATGTKNASSSGTLVVVDAIDVNRPGTRFEETEPAVSFSGSWVQGNLNRAWSLGTIAETGVAGASVSFTFTGTEVSWIGCRKLSTGIADVYLDGVFQTEIDTFLAPPIEAYQHTIFKATGLANGTHTLTIVVTGRTNPAATNNVIVIDAFDVRP